MTSTTLREISALPTTPAVLSDATVILVDYQNTYTRGVLRLDGWERALDEAAELLARARAEGAEVIHVMHDGGEGSPYDIRQDIGRIHERVAPAPGERVVVKTAPNAFVGTELGDLVDAAGHDNVVIAGFMTHMCVTFTAEGAFLRGNAPTVVAAACATRALPSAAGPVSAAEQHRAALATIGDLYGVVVASAADLG
ncbi:isochorismatase family protein [Goodfellowiella coeruleoviolacea]|uniref:Nicotinamidase-related amidase n=1 Tax=Goodfellowiella coeruleoviolacea TaxID=334858 RepID=A0AAE3KDZ7_9PSEU|nr:isochorismatase family protein [Goodfellowiella coeruleoviolacea]MCP2163265.1 Nicotinamidase-related amidase [Goodfellowiella coeruleoviolacea]